MNPLTLFGVPALLLARTAWANVRPPSNCSLAGSVRRFPRCSPPRTLDMFGEVVKTKTFELEISLVSTTVELGARGETRAVGQAMEGAVVKGYAAIFDLDFPPITTLARWLA